VPYGENSFHKKCVFHLFFPPRPLLITAHGNVTKSPSPLKMLQLQEKSGIAWSACPEEKNQLATHLPRFPQRPQRASIKQMRSEYGKARAAGSIFPRLLF